MRSLSFVSMILVSGLLLAVGCGGDSKNDNNGNSGTSGGSAGTSGSAGTAGSAGAGGTSTGGSAGTGGSSPNTSRGELADFPDEENCLEGCVETCAAVVDCGSEDSSFPMDKEECESRCELGLDGPIWDDVTGNFRCCASQDSCDDKATCGGWLNHPDVSASCDRLCECVAGVLDAVPQAKSIAPPKGYTYAEDTLVFEGSGVADLTSQPGQEVVWGGRYAAIRFTVPITERFLRANASKLRVVPTFRDSAGLLAAAPGDVIVRATSPALLQKAGDLAKSHGLRAPEKVTFAKDLYLLRGGSGWRALEAYHALNEVPGLKAELDMMRNLKVMYEPNDPLFPEQWHLKNTGQEESVPGVDSRVTEAWDVTLGSSEVVIAIQDDGVDVNHPDLAGDVVGTINHENFPSGSVGHGTSVAGVAAATGDNNEGGSGVCPGCSIFGAFIGLGPGSSPWTDMQIAQSFTDLVDQGAWVINNSWGAGFGDVRFETQQLGTPPPLPMVTTESLDYAETNGRDGKGTVVLFAAGNENSLSIYYTAHPTVVGVGAVDNQGLKSYYSSWGQNRVDIAAPSDGGLSGITTTSLGDGYTDSFGGTSSACPFASGVAGLVLSANPELTAAEVRDILQNTATQIDPVHGQYDDDGVSPFYGHGLLNAYTAVQMASGSCADPADCPAPSDVCSDSCDGAQCSPCRTNADCAPGNVCQALPELGQTVCVEPADQGVCPMGTRRVNDFCLPSRETCGFCSGNETCNGRDDDCDGTIDGDAACPDGGLNNACPGTDGAGCAMEQVCAATGCARECLRDEDCDEGATCDLVKNRYGQATGATACNTDLAAGCPAGCRVLASSLHDGALESFVSCMEDGEAECGAGVFGCAIQLPVAF